MLCGIWKTKINTQMEQVQVRVGFGEAIKRAFSKYCCFSGRASRSEYWWFVLFNWLVCMCIVILFGLLAGDDPYASDNAFSTIWLIWWLVVLLPYLGLCWRRLHDIDKSGNYFSVTFVPFVGGIIWLIWMCKPSDIWANDYGDVPNLVETKQ